MRRSFGFLIGLVLVLGLAAMTSAQQSATAASQKHHAASGKVFKGTVDAVTLADPAKGTKSEITVVDAQKKSLVFLVKSTTTLYDVSGTAITLDKIIKGNKVRVRYQTTAEGLHEAASVRLTKHG
jgi:hypothetical protein